MNKKLVLGVLLVGLIVFLGINFGQYLTLENAKAQQIALSEYINNNFVLAAVTYFLAYVAITAFSIPGGLSAVNIFKKGSHFVLEARL